MSAVANEPIKTIAQRLVPKSLTAYFAKQMWGPMMPMASRLSPKLLAKFSALMDTDDFAAAVAATSDENLAAGMQGPLREVVLNEIVNRMKTEFVSSRAKDLDAIIQFEVTGRPDGGTDIYQVRIKDAKCEVAQGAGFEGAPASVIVVDAVDFLKMAVGVVSGIDLYLGGKLKWDGGLMMLTRLTRMFNIPAAAPAQAAA